MRRGALIQSLHLRGPRINWLQMAHMVPIKDNLAAAGSPRAFVWCVRVVVCGLDYTFGRGPGDINARVCLHLCACSCNVWGSGFLSKTGISPFFGGWGGGDVFFGGFLLLHARSFSALPSCLFRSSVSSDKRVKINRVFAL